MKRLLALALTALMLALTACAASDSTNGSVDDPIFDDGGFNSIGGRSDISSATLSQADVKKAYDSYYTACQATEGLGEYSLTQETVLSLSVDGVSVELRRVTSSALADAAGNRLTNTDTDIKDEHNRFTGQTSEQLYSDKAADKTFVRTVVTDLSGASNNSVSVKSSAYRANHLSDLMYKDLRLSQEDITAVNQKTSTNTEVITYDLTLNQQAEKRLMVSLLGANGVECLSSAITVSHLVITVSINAGLMTSRTVSGICTVAADEPMTYSFTQQFSLKSNRTSEITRPDWAA